MHIHPVQRPDGVVVVRAHRPFCVEEAHEPIIALAAHPRVRQRSPRRFSLEMVTGFAAQDECAKKRLRPLALSLAVYPWRRRRMMILPRMG